MKIYIASSWKNEVNIRDLADLLRSWGHEVDCFCDESTGRFVFCYSEIDNYKDLDAISFLKVEEPQKAFKQDKEMIDWADVVVMVLPCGKSSHLEAGYAVGSGKKLFILGEFPKGEFDVMYGFADLLTRDLEDIKHALGGSINGKA